MVIWSIVNLDSAKHYLEFSSYLTPGLFCCCCLLFLKNNMPRNCIKEISGWEWGASLFWTVRRIAIKECRKREPMWYWHSKRCGGKESANQRRRCKRHRFNPWVGRNPLEEGMVTCCSVLAWRIPWTEEPGGLQFIGLQRAGHDWSNLAHTQGRWEPYFSDKLLWDSSVQETYIPFL